MSTKAIPVNKSQFDKQTGASLRHTRVFCDFFYPFYIAVINISQIYVLNNQGVQIKTRYGSKHAFIKTSYHVARDVNEKKRREVASRLLIP